MKNKYYIYIILSLTLIFILYSNYIAISRDNDLETSMYDEESFNIYIKRIFDCVDQNNLNILENMRKEIESINDSSISLAYSLALYIVSPKKYENQYVDNFPNDSNGINDLYKLELKQKLPHFLYSIDLIGKIALKGNEKAITKIFNDIVYSDGVIAEAFSDLISKIIKNKTLLSFKVLSENESLSRSIIYSCLNELTPKEFNVLKEEIINIKSKDSRILQIKNEILNFKYKYYGVAH